MWAHVLLTVFQGFYTPQSKQLNLCMAWGVCLQAE